MNPTVVFWLVLAAVIIVVVLAVIASWWSGYEAGSRETRAQLRTTRREDPPTSPATPPTSPAVGAISTREWWGSQPGAHSAGTLDVDVASRWAVPYQRWTSEYAGRGYATAVPVDDHGEYLITRRSDAVTASYPVVSLPSDVDDEVTRLLDSPIFDALIRDLYPVLALTGGTR